jgi:hypothetical protein
MLNAYPLLETFRHPWPLIRDNCYLVSLLKLKLSFVAAIYVAIGQHFLFLVCSVPGPGSSTCIYSGWYFILSARMYNIDSFLQGDIPQLRQQMKQEIERQTIL